MDMLNAGAASLLIKVRAVPFTAERPTLAEGFAAVEVTYWLPLTSLRVVTERFVPVAFPKLNPVVAVIVPDAEMVKKLVLFVDETTAKIFAVCPASPSKRTVEDPTFEDCTVNAEVEVAPMPYRSVEVVEYTNGLLRDHPTPPPEPEPQAAPVPAMRPAALVCKHWLAIPERVRFVMVDDGVRSWDEDAVPNTEKSAVDDAHVRFTSDVVVVAEL